MSRPTLHSIVRPVVAVAACLAALALIQRVQDNDSAAATRGLVATVSGKAFSGTPGGSGPVMNVRDLRQGQATSGTVTVRNPGSDTRYFWLSPGRVADRIGPGGGRVSSAVSVTVMDVTDVTAPATVYRGPLKYVGARPLGFLSPGARRSFSFLAELPTGGRSPAAPASDPYRGSSAQIAWSWHSLSGRPDTPAVAAAPKPKPKPKPVERPRDAKPPKLAFSVPRRQDLIGGRALALTVRCGEDCVVQASSQMRSGGRSAKLGTRSPGKGLAPTHAITVRFSAAQAGALRNAMLSGRATKIHVAVEAHDRAGNRKRDTHAITLRPQG